jgi:hypothetical protein
VPTFDVIDDFWADWDKLSFDLQRRFLRARNQLIADLIASGRPRPSLRLKRVVTHPGVWEMTWAPDGRATFYYGEEVIPGEPHVIWRRSGSQDILRRAVVN